MQQNGNNPLISENKADTIDRLNEYVEWLCLASDGDDMVHPGMLLSLHTVREAVKSLKA